MDSINQPVFRQFAAAFIALWVSLDVCAFIPTSERNVLLELYANTNCDSWTNRTNWNGPTGTECAWYGVTCSASNANVIAVSLSGNNLVGALPATLNQLTALQSFNVSNNRLFGAFPSLAGLSVLQDLRVSGNQLSGTLPALTGLNALRTVRADSNRLTGQIPSLAGLDRLEEFRTNRNQLTGSIPPLVGLSNLRVFVVETNQLTGSIPALSGLIALQIFDVSGNRLIGPIPALAGLNTLQIFDASQNQLSGSIPQLDGTGMLRTFSVFSNQLTGSLPSLTALSALQLLSLQNNQLTGTIPALAGLSALQQLNVQANQLTGEIPAAPPSLEANGSRLCPNQLTPSEDAAWDAATGSSPWSSGCTVPRIAQSLTIDAATALTVGGTVQINVQVAPQPGASTPLIYTLLTPSVCSVNSEGFISAFMTAAPGSPCTITADKAGDGTYNSAPQASLSLVVCGLDFDGDGSANALTDGLILLRYFGNNSPTVDLTEHARATGGARPYTLIQAGVETLRDSDVLDLDGDGHVLASRDGLMILRMILGFKESEVVIGAVNPLAPRNTWHAISEYINTRCGTSF